MNKALVGYTGFVGGNIFEAGEFDGLYNSKNISDSFGTSPDLLIYAGLRAEKYLANNAPEKDMDLIIEAEKNIENINPKRLVLISTVDVFINPNGADENKKIDTDGLHPYGLNRYRLEQWVSERYTDALIIRLPGLFGKGIKKNFIYDYINVIPFMLTEQKLSELNKRDSEISKYYIAQGNGFYKVNVDDSEKEMLKGKFRSLGFSALNFTDSRSKYQFYDLSRLWEDIQTALDAELKLWHPATEPISAGELYKYLTGKDFVNELSSVPVNYDFRTIYGNLFGGSNGYICSKDQVLRQIKSFCEKEKRS